MQVCRLVRIPLGVLCIEINFLELYYVKYRGGTIQTHHNNYYLPDNMYIWIEGRQTNY